MASKGTIAPVMHTGGLAALARALSRDEFARRFAHPFLLRPRKLDTGEFLLDGDALDAELRTVEELVELAGGVVDRLRFAPLVRNLLSPYRAFVSVGSADNCDLVLKHRSISKLHALFWIPGEGEQWRVADARSARGTRINGEPLEALDKRVVRPGDAIRFGDVIARLVDAAQVYDLVNPKEKHRWGISQSARMSLAR
jgi:FHA domain